MLEKIFLVRIKEMINRKQLILGHQFGFRDKHVVIKQLHRLTNKIIRTLKDKNYYTYLFLDIEKAFGKV